MADAKRDANFVPTALGVSNADNTTPLLFKIDSTTGRLLVDSSGGGGDVTGPASSTDNAVARFDGTTGKVIQNSAVTIADTTGNISGLQKITIGVVSSATGSIELKGTTSGTVTVKTADAAGTYTLTLPTNDGNNGEFLQTDGNGVLTWAAGASGANTALSNLASVAINTSLISDTDNTDALGSATIGWSDLFLGSGAVINFNNGDVTITHSSNNLTFAGGNYNFTTPALAGGAVAFTFTPGNHTAVTSGVESTVFEANTITITDNLATQFFTVFDQPTISAASALTTTIAGNVEIAGVPLPAGAGPATLTSTVGLLVAGGEITTAGAATTVTAAVAIAFTNPVESTNVTVTNSIGLLHQYASATTQTSPNVGMLLDFDTNYTTSADALTGVVIKIDSTNTTSKNYIACQRDTTPVFTLGLGGGAAFGSTITPLANDGAALGTTALKWSDLFLADGGVINFSSGDVTITQGTNTLTFAGASSGYFLNDGSVSINTSNVIAKLNIKQDSGNTTLADETPIIRVFNQDTTNNNFSLLGFAMQTDDLVPAGVVGMVNTDHTAGSADSNFIIAPVVNSTVTEIIRVTNTAIQPGTSDGTALGTSTKMFSDLFLASGGVINFNNGDVTITHSADTLAFAGGSYTFAGAVTPAANDGSALGTTALQWSDLFLAEGGVINWDNGDLTLTQTNNELVLAGGNLDIGANTLRLAGPLDYRVEPATDDTYEGPSTNDLNAGATIAQWEAVYLDSSSTWQLTDADAEATAGGVMVALATESGTNGNPLNVLLPGSIARNDGWTWTAGGEIYLSGTAGALTQTAPSGTDDVIRIVGYALTDDCIYWNPSNDWITHT